MMESFSKVCPTCKKEYSNDVVVCPDDNNQLAPLAKDALVGTVFADKYEILSVLGAGGMSVIYKARHKYMERICAVKLLHPFLLSDASMFQRFQYEAKAASNLSHPNVVAMHDFGITNDGKAYLVMDYLEGEDLSTVLERDVLLTEPQAREIFRQALAGLDHAHSKGVIHRDLKPSNLFLIPQTDGSVLVKLVDFGIAKITDSSSAAQNLTRTGEVFGSPLYMSPEQCSGKSLDARSDIYSLGCLMYEALCGRRPLVGESALETMHMHIKDVPLTISQAAPKLGVSHQLEDAVMKCLCKRPDDRFSSVAELYQEIYGEPLPKVPVPHSVSGTDSQIVIPTPGSSATAASIRKADEITDKSGLYLTPSDKKKLLPIAVALGILILALGSGTYWIAFVWPGPETDRGTLINRWVYTFWIDRGDKLAKQQNFNDAFLAYDNAEQSADKFGDNFGRKVNVLRAKLKLASNMNQPKKTEQILRSLGQVNRDQAIVDCELARKEIARIAALYEATLASKKGGRKTSVYELAMQMGTKIEAFIGISRRLAAVQAYDDQEDLLTRAVHLYTQLAGDDDPQLADLKTELAYSHWQQDEVSQVRPLLAEALAIKIKVNERSKSQASNIDEGEAWLRLGQFDRDRSKFDEAEKELSKALSILHEYKKLDKNSNNSVRAYKLLTEALNAMADYKAQTHKEAEAVALRDEVAVLKRVKLDYHPDIE
jgi:serine/threonine protein kinase